MHLHLVKIVIMRHELRPIKPETTFRINLLVTASAERFYDGEYDDSK